MIPFPADPPKPIQFIQIGRHILPIDLIGQVILNLDGTDAVRVRFRQGSPSCYQDFHGDEAVEAARLFESLCINIG